MVFFECAPDTPLPPEHPASQQVRRCQTQPNSPTQIAGHEKRIGTRNCCSKRNREHHPKERSAAGQMRFEGSLRIEIFFFAKCIGQEQGEGYPGQEEDTMKRLCQRLRYALTRKPRRAVLFAYRSTWTEPPGGILSLRSELHRAVHLQANFLEVMPTIRMAGWGV